ncbi:MAG TPA: YiiD C-terminal domain-containing protein [Dehalococcoidia bacterium]|nr:YiiD C-terminal domain-containing protein [Dehalococcoidia bacterium]
MDYEPLKQMLMSVVPFNRHLGLEIIDIGPGTASVRLPQEPQLTNHVGTQHAAALFAAAEAASGGAMAGAFADLMMNVTPLARDAQIRYLKPARGPITASARVAEDHGAVRARLEADGKTDFSVDIQLTDENGVKVAEMTVSWHIRMNG